MDRGALSEVPARGFLSDGTLPLGRRARDGVITAHYRLNELSETSYLSSTHKFVLRSDPTLIIARTPLLVGIKVTDVHP